MKRILFGVLIGLFLMFHVAPAHANLVSGQIATGTIAAGGTSDQYFTGTAGQAAMFSTVATYPYGYWILEKPMGNGGWQPIDPSTMKPGTRPETHVPLPAPDLGEPDS